MSYMKTGSLDDGEIAFYYNTISTVAYNKFYQYGQVQINNWINQNYCGLSICTTNRLFIEALSRAS